MKYPIISIILLFGIATAFNTHVEKVQAVEASDIVGVYWTADKEAQVKIFLATNGKYSGKTVWMKEPNKPDGSPKLDEKNPNEELRTRERLGLVPLKYFEFNEEEQRWENGTVYDPNNGKTYDGYMKFADGDKNRLLLRGYISGMTWLGRTSEWTRVTD